MLEMTLSVPDMTCDHCVRTISSALGDVEGVRTVAVDLSSKTVRVTGAAERTAVCAALDEVGYEVAS